ncbi:putative transmembrane protein [Rhizoctonia solani 123E]|uniref:Putative transmembrane protein n=1 Tax=Rhizoctonia solani 123E TaxID=1423351 RepID=A0A074S275_9AGAM|nr:putative transmembrane protein [Rhizoctonia solani 123E]
MEVENSDRSLYAPVLRGLTYLQHAPTPFITTFILIHLSAPALASIGGTEVANQVMLLGREYYHGVPQENLLVYLPITIHVGASLVKRTVKLGHQILVGPRTDSRLNTHESTTANTSPLTVPDILVWTGYPLFLVLVPHIATHRLIPSTPAPPISSISPSELDYAFVHFGLKNWPIRSWAMYAVLVGSGITHAIYGMPVVWRQMILKILKKFRAVHSESRLGTLWRVSPKTGLLGISVVLLGVMRISRENLFISRLAETRMASVYRMSVLYRW